MMTKRLLINTAISAALSGMAYPVLADVDSNEPQAINAETGEESSSDSSQPNNAQSTSPKLEVITVTSQKRIQSLQSVPISVQAIHGSKLAKSNISRLQDLSDYMPNVTVAKSSTNARIYIRGIGTDSNGGFEQSVAIFNDGMYMGRGQQSKFPFIDIERLEVLKGPQGVLFGKNATAGALNTTSKNPTNDFEGEVRFAAGQYGERTSHLVLSGPLTETLAGRVALFGRKFDGYMYNAALNRDEEQRDEFGGRGTLLWTPDDNLTVNLKWESGVFDTTGSNYQVTYDPSAASKLEVLMGEGKLDDKSAIANGGLLGGGPVENKTKLDNLTLRIDSDIGDHTLTTITGYSKYTWDNAIDADFSKLSIAYQDRDEVYSQLSQEIRLLSPLDETFDYIVGGYYQINDLDIDVYSLVDAAMLGAPITAGGLGQFKQESKTFAVFGQLNWHLNEELTATLGLRWAKEDKDVTDQMVTGLHDLSPSRTGDSVIGKLGGVAHQLKDNRNEKHTSPTFRLQWDQNRNAMYYASLSKGFKGGGFDASGLNGSEGSIANDSFEFEDENVTAFELGGKLSLQDGAAIFNWAFYYSDYEDLQVSTYNGAGYVIGNAAKATVQGIETEYRWAVNEEFTFTINAAYLDYEYDEFDNAPCTVAQETQWSGDSDCTQDLSGKRGALTPKITASSILKYETEIGSDLLLLSSLSLNYSDSYNTESDLDLNLEQDAYTKVGLYMALTDMEESWEIALIGKNITDEKISTAGNDNPLIDFAYRRYLEMPSQWSVQGTYRF